MKNIIILNLTTVLLFFINFYFSGPIWVYPMWMLTHFILILICKRNYDNKKEKKALLSQTPQLNHETIHDLETAKRVQEALLNIDTQSISKLKIEKQCIPASTLGGDFYTFIEKSIDKLTPKKTSPGILEYSENHNDIIGVAIGDVAGHGVSSALVMALSSGILGRIAINNNDPNVVLKKTNTDIQKFISSSQISHVTAFYCTINLSEMTLTYSCAGHPAGILVKPDSSVEFLSTNGLFLGMYPDENYTENKTSISNGDRLLLFTDGISETLNEVNDTFGADRLKDIMLKHKNKSIKEIKEIIFQDIQAFQYTKDVKDDQTLILIEICNHVD